MLDLSQTRELLERLAGQTAPLCRAPHDLRLFHAEDSALGYSQLNELLLLFGFDRVSPCFFRFLIDGQTEYEAGQALETAEDFEAGVQRFQKLGILLYGYVKYAFKLFAQNEAALKEHLAGLEPIEDEVFESRHATDQIVWTSRVLRRGSWIALGDTTIRARELSASPIHSVFR